MSNHRLEKHGVKLAS